MDHRILHAFLAVLTLAGVTLESRAQSNYFDPLEFTTVTGAAGVAGSTDAAGELAKYSSPNGIAADFNQYFVYVADTGNNTIRKIEVFGVSTFAGSPGVTGSADGAGNSALFSAPWGVAVDVSGNVYVADTGNNTIRKITSSGVVSTIAGTPGAPGSTDGTGASARFNGPRGIAVDGSGNIYVADTGNDTIRMIRPAGVVTTLAGTPGRRGSSDGLGPAALFASPGGITVDPLGNIFVADTGNDTIRRVSQSGAVTTIAGTAGVAGSADGAGSAALFSGPRGIAVDAFENVLVADTGNDTIRAFSGVPGQVVVITVAGEAGIAGSTDGPGGAALFSSPGAVSIGWAGTYLVADTGNDTTRASPDVQPPLKWTVSPSNQAAVTGGFAVFNVIVAGNLPPIKWQLNGVDISGETSTSLIIQNIQPLDAGVYSAVPSDGTNDVGWDFATLTVNAPISFSARTVSWAVPGGPYGIAVDPLGSIYVTAGDAVERLSPAGVITLLAGSLTQSGSADGVGSAARFALPTGLATDAQGNIYVADSGNNSIRKVTPGGVVTTLAGSTLGTADGLGSAAKFNNPTALDVDATGNVYVVDSGNDELREITPGGSTSTILGTDAIANLSWIGLPYQIMGVALDGTDTPQVLAGNSATDMMPFSLLFHPNAPSNDPWETQFFWETGGPPQTGSMTSDIEGNTYVAYDGQVWFRDPDYSWYQQAIGTYNIGGGPEVTLASGPVGTVYVADSIRQTVTALSTTGGFNFATPAPLPPPVTVLPTSPLSYPLAGAAPVIPTAPPSPTPTPTPPPGSQWPTPTPTSPPGTQLPTPTPTSPPSFQTPTPTPAPPRFGPTPTPTPLTGTQLPILTPTPLSGAPTPTPTQPSTITQSTSLGASSGVTSTTRLANISSRAFVGLDSNVEIAGFVVSGAPGSTEQVLIRGIGPALSQFGVGGALASPVLTLFDSTGNLIASNTGWGTNANASLIAAAIQATGAFALPPGSEDSALLVDLPPGAYTAQVTGLNGATGVALAEVYEVSNGIPRLMNISTRAFVGTGSSVEIAGIDISGTNAATVLIRAVGPSLGQLGVPGVLAQPSLSVVDSAGNTVASNVGWSSASNASQIASVALAVGAFALPNGSADCALLLTLPPGTYTAIVSGVGGSNGVALVEAYEAP